MIEWYLLVLYPDGREFVVYHGVSSRSDAHDPPQMVFNGGINGEMILMDYAAWCQADGPADKTWPEFVKLADEHIGYFLREEGAEDVELYIRPRLSFCVETDTPTPTDLREGRGDARRVEGWGRSAEPTVPDWLGSLADFDTCSHLDDEERWAIRGIALVLGPHNPDDTRPQAALANACWWWHENVEDPPIFEENWDEDELLADFGRLAAAHPTLARVVSERAARLDGDDLERAELEVPVPPSAATRLVNVLLADGSRRLMRYPVRCGQCGEWREDETEHISALAFDDDDDDDLDLDDPEEQEEVLTRPGHTTCRPCWDDMDNDMAQFKAAH